MEKKSTFSFDGGVIPSTLRCQAPLFLTGQGHRKGMWQFLQNMANNVGLTEIESTESDEELLLALSMSSKCCQSEARLSWSTCRKN